MFALYFSRSIRPALRCRKKIKRKAANATPTNPAEPAYTAILDVWGRASHFWEIVRSGVSDLLIVSAAVEFPLD